MPDLKAGIKLNFAVPCVLGILSAIILFSGLDGSLRDWDESVYAQVARENYRSGDWYNLYWNKGVWIDKPPLMIWFTRLVYGFFGIGEWQARIGSALAGCIIIMIIYFWVRKVSGIYAGFLAGIILLGVPHFVRVAKMGQLDVPVAMFVTASMYFFYTAFNDNKNFMYLLSGISTGLALMTKWVVGLFPVFVQLCLSVIPEYRTVLRNKYWWIGNVVAVIVILPWFLQQYLCYGDVFLGHFIGIKLFGSISSEIAGHGGGILYYLDIMISKSRPWVFVFIPIFFLLIFRAVKRDKISVFLLFWFGVIFILFSISRTKLHWYIMPVYPPMAFICAYLLSDIVSGSKTRKILIASALIIIPAHIFFSRDYIKLDLNPEMKNFISATAGSFGKIDKLYVYKGTFSPSLMFYTDKKVLQINSDEELNLYLNRDRELVVIADKKACGYLDNIISTGSLKTARPAVITEKYNAYFIKK